MANTLEDLYLKYRNKVQRYLESDGYYEYLLGMIQSSPQVITQNNRTLHKEVDEKWLTAVEEAIPAIHDIIGKPRRFIKSVESVVPVELAKKITSDSVRHLCQNTQNIAGMSGGMIMPNRILTVENEESLDLYENRFIHTLIQKLVRFIDKRTDIIFWSTGDERYSILKMETRIEDDYEEIEYKLDMVIKNKQSYLENDESHMEVFKRIDRVRRIIMDFKRSAFEQVMKDTSPVRSPIQRTNLLTKEPNYKKCYALWQFLERYDEVGYEIDVKETALDFDEDYLFQMYSNLALNYTVFKTILDADPRRIADAPAKRRKTVKPKFIKQIVEEFVDDYDIPDVEIRKVIIEEISKAQLEIEKKRALKERAAAKAAKEKERIAKAKAREKAAKAKAAAMGKERVARAKALEKTREKEKAAKAAALEKERIAKEKAREKEKAQREKAILLEKERIAKAKALEKAREKEKAAKAAALEKERIAKEKAREKEKAAKAKTAGTAKRKSVKVDNPSQETNE